MIFRSMVIEKKKRKKEKKAKQLFIQTNTNPSTFKDKKQSAKLF